jgi:preprotein translocase subunit SecG
MSAVDLAFLAGAFSATAGFLAGRRSYIIAVLFFGASLVMAVAARDLA